MNNGKTVKLRTFKRRHTMKFTSLLCVTGALLTGCGTSHLDCDSQENQASVMAEINVLIDEYLHNKFDDAEAVTFDNAHPNISIAYFNQHVIDVNAKKCDYFINATFENSGETLTELQVTAEFRSTGVNGKTHELQNFYVGPSQSVKLGRAAVKNRG